MRRTCSGVMSMALAGAGRGGVLRRSVSAMVKQQTLDVRYMPATAMWVRDGETSQGRVRLRM